MIRWVLILWLAGIAPVWSDEPLARLQGLDNRTLEADLLDILGTSETGPDDEIAMRRDLRTARDRAQRYLRAQGYYAAIIEGDIGDDGRPLLQIETGARFTIGVVTTETVDPQATVIAATAIGVVEGEFLTAQAVLDAEARGLAALRNGGWPEADAGARQVIVDHARAAGDITFRFLPGPFTRFGGVDLQTDGWRDTFIHRLAGLQPGEPAQAEAVDAYRERLESLASVATASVRFGPAENGIRPLQVSLEPAPKHAIEATVSLSTADGAGISTAWSRRNFYGGDETLTLTAEIASLTQALTAGLSFPYWQRLDQRLELAAGVKSEDTDAYQQDEVSVSVDLYRELDDDLDLRLGAIADASRVTDATGVRDIYSLRINSALALDQRDDPLEPRSGVQAAILLNPGVSFGDTEATYLQAEARASSYYALNDHLTAAARVRLGSIVGVSAADLPADLRFYAGGGGSARGFEYQSLSPIGPDGAPFGGLSVTELNAELRWRGNGRWGAVAFIDTAFAGASRTPEFDDLRTGVGIGLRYYFDFAPVRLDLATPLDRRSGEDAVHVYISIGQAF
ncbi:autotransporter assembly complex protein TamA [Hyphobacterium sp.]|jgi:translocation and assembly module TamA|uniref:autotransporter assembly complex protein TamA n=1 Tax=Hyphobacterium sp. TaxID=2004662 RepID=UPI003BABCFB6